MGGNRADMRLRGERLWIGARGAWCVVWIVCGGRAGY